MTSKAALFEEHTRVAKTEHHIFHVDPSFTHGHENLVEGDVENLLFDLETNSWVQCEAEVVDERNVNFVERRTESLNRISCRQSRTV